MRAILINIPKEIIEEIVNLLFISFSFQRTPVNLHIILIIIGFMIFAVNDHRPCNGYTLCRYGVHQAKRIKRFCIALSFLFFIVLAGTLKSVGKKYQSI